MSSEIEKAIDETMDQIRASYAQVGVYDAEADPDPPAVDHIAADLKTMLTSYELYICTICENDFDSKKAFGSHIKRFHGKSKVYTYARRRYICVHCFQPTYTERTAAKHLVGHGGKRKDMENVILKVLENRIVNDYTAPDTNEDDIMEDLSTMEEKLKLELLQQFENLKISQREEDRLIENPTKFFQFQGMDLADERLKAIVPELAEVGNGDNVVFALDEDPPVHEEVQKAQQNILNQCLGLIKSDNEKRASLDKSPPRSLLATNSSLTTRNTPARRTTPKSTTRTTPPVTTPNSTTKATRTLKWGTGELICPNIDHPEETETELDSGVNSDIELKFEEEEELSSPLPSEAASSEPASSEPVAWDLNSHDGSEADVDLIRSEPDLEMPYTTDATDPDIDIKEEFVDNTDAENEIVIKTEATGVEDLDAKMKSIHGDEDEENDLVIIDELPPWKDPGPSSTILKPGASHITEKKAAKKQIKKVAKKLPKKEDYKGTLEEYKKEKNALMEKERRARSASGLNVLKDVLGVGRMAQQGVVDLATIECQRLNKMQEVIDQNKVLQDRLEKLRREHDERYEEYLATK